MRSNQEKKPTEIGGKSLRLSRLLCEWDSRKGGGESNPRGGEERTRSTERKMGQGVSQERKKRKAVWACWNPQLSFAAGDSGRQIRRGHAKTRKTNRDEVR